MASLRTFAFLAIFILLHLNIAASNFLAPFMSPLIDDVCNGAQCGRGKCKPSTNGTFPFYKCECDLGWTQTRSDDDDDLSFLPCIIPNCTLNTACAAAPSPVQDKESKSNVSIFDLCRWTDCGGGSCNKTSLFTYTCECSEGYSNLLNVSSFPCYKQCAIGMDCTNLGISISNKSSATTSPSSQNDVNQGLMLLGNYYWAIISILLLVTFA